MKSNFFGIGFPGMLTITFIVLKATGYIDWSWWWVVAPMCVPLVLIVALMGFCFVMHFIQKPSNR